MGMVLSTILLTIGVIGEAGLAIYTAILAHRKDYTKIMDVAIANTICSIGLVVFALILAIGLL